ncbi:MAG: hypothetical protein AMXMBFR64_36840 [Myxococcales bacterium]
MATTRKGVEKVSRIIEAASQLFSRHGFRKTTLEEIAEAAKMGKATLYHYFPNGKEQIFGAVLQHVVDGLFNRIVAELTGAGSVTERLASYLRIRVRVYHEQVRMFAPTAEIMEELYPLAEAELRRYLDRELELLTVLIASGVKAGEFRTVDASLIARVLQTSLKGLSSDAPFDIGPEERQRETEEFLKLVMHGLLA